MSLEGKSAVWHAGCIYIVRHFLSQNFNNFNILTLLLQSLSIIFRKRRDMRKEKGFAANLYSTRLCWR
jgi:hypothetical protein